MAMIMKSGVASKSKSDAMRAKGPASAEKKASADGWRHDNIGRLLNSAIRCFEERVLELMTQAGHGDTRLSHVSLTRNLDRSGTRVTELARRSAMTKQAMGELVDQCEALGLVERTTDPSDRRARTVTFTKAGLVWLEDFRRAVERAEKEMRDQVGTAALEQIKKALKRYASAHDTLRLGE
jgi:DNA-binding MarR family transcriptional regulator